MNPPKQTCACGRGKKSAYDGKCGHCRTQRERKAHRKLVDAHLEAKNPQ